MKQKLIALSKEKGFKSEQILFDSVDGLSDKRYYLWMCELALWLTTESGVYCSSNPVGHLKEWQAAVEHDDIINFKTVYDSITDAKTEETRFFDTKPKGLEAALTEGLKLTEKKVK